MLSIATVSCSDGNPDTPQPNPENQKYFLMLDIVPLATGTSGLPLNKEIIEAISDYRVILIKNLNNTSSIVANDYKELETELIPGKTFNTPVYTNTIDGGVYDIYVIANEKSVGNVSISENSTPVDFSNYLSNFTSESNNVNELVNILNNGYFSPDYSHYESNKIYLPYTCCYKGIKFVEEENQSHQINETMYLVPIATKFELQFINYRNHQVNISDIVFSKIGISNFIFAQVGEDQQEISYKGVNYPWPEWLYNVSTESWLDENASFGGNIDFNRKYGWITEYYVPNDPEVNFKEYKFMDGESSSFIVAGDSSEEKTNPGKKILGPFYLPETGLYNIDNNEDTRDNDTDDNEGNDGENNVYFLSMDIVDSTSDKNPEFKDVAVSNLGALFRDTYVVITIIMREGTYDIYAEIKDWNRFNAWGWVE